jgi:hypothetical protein
MHEFFKLDESEGLESDMSKVCTYQLSAHNGSVQSAYLSGRLLYLVAFLICILIQLLNVHVEVCSF